MNVTGGFMSIKKILPVLCFLFFITSINAQAPLLIEGLDEIVRFQTDLSKLTGGVITFRSSPNDYVGYMGIHRARPGDVEIGTTLGNAGSVNITVHGDPKLTIKQDGSVIIKTLQGLPDSGPRPVTASPAGNLHANPSLLSYTIPCTSLIANDQDGEFTTIVNPVGNVQFIQHTANTGELYAPIRLPKNVTMLLATVYYVNLGTSSARFSILQEPFTPAIDQSPINITGIVSLPVAGSFSGSSGIDMASKVVTFNNRLFPSNSLLGIEINCSDCSKLFIRSVKILYQYQ